MHIKKQLRLKFLLLIATFCYFGKSFSMNTPPPEQATTQQPNENGTPSTSAKFKPIAPPKAPPIIKTYSRKNPTPRALPLFLDASTKTAVPQEDNVAEKTPPPNTLHTAANQQLPTATSNAAPQDNQAERDTGSTEPRNPFNISNFKPTYTTQHQSRARKIPIATSKPSPQHQDPLVEKNTVTPLPGTIATPNVLHSPQKISTHQQTPSDVSDNSPQQDQLPSNTNGTATQTQPNGDNDQERYVTGYSLTPLNKESTQPQDSLISAEMLGFAHTITAILPLLPAIIANNAHANNDTITGHGANLATHLLAIANSIISCVRFPNDALHYRITNLLYDTAYTNICIAELKKNLHAQKLMHVLVKRGTGELNSEAQPIPEKTIFKLLEITALPLLQTMCSLAATSKDVKIRRIAEGCGTCVKIFTGYKAAITATSKRTHILALCCTLLALTHDFFTLDQIIEHKPKNKDPLVEITNNAQKIPAAPITSPNEEKDLSHRGTNTNFEKPSLVEITTQTNPSHFPILNLRHEFNAETEGRPESRAGSRTESRCETAPPLGLITPTKIRNNPEAVDQETMRRNRSTSSLEGAAIYWTQE